MASPRGNTARWVALIILGTWAGVWWQTDLTRWKPGRLPQASGHAGAFLRSLWTQRAARALAIAVDPIASRIGIIGANGDLRLVDATGQVAFERSVAGADALVMTGSDKVIATFARRDPARTALTFLRPDGTEIWKHDVGDAIEDAAVAQSGELAACVTTGGRIYSYKLDGHPTYHHWRSVGSPRQVYVTPDSSLLLVATADPPGAWAYTPRGEFAWKAPNADATGSAQLFASPNGRFVACVATPKETGASAYVSRFIIMSSSGRQQWGARLRASSAEVALSQDGQYAAVTYARTVVARGQATLERKVALFRTSSAGGSIPDELWQHGGPFYDPRLVCIAADGSFVATHDGQRSIFFFSPAGQLLWRHKMASPIARTVASTDGLSIVVHCLDGSLSLLRVAGAQGL